VKSKRFETIFGFAIIVQSVLLTYTTNQEMMNLETVGVDFFDWFFMLCFSIELGMRLSVHRWYFFVRKDRAWNIFDILLVLTSLYLNLCPIILDIETKNAAFLTSLRVVKIIRVFRVVRLIRVFPGLGVMLSFVGKSMLSVAWSFAMMAFCFYVFGLALMQDLAVSMRVNNDLELLREVRDIFGSVPLAMFTLLRSVWGGEDWDKYRYIITEASPRAAWCFTVFICFVQISLFNVITAMFILQAQTLGKPDQETLAIEENDKHLQQYKQIERLSKQLDADGCGTISAEELQRGLENDHMRSEFMVCGLDIHDAEGFFRLLLETSDNELDIETFVDACMRVKGGASGLDQYMQLLEARRFQSSVGEHILDFKHWRNQVTKKLDGVCGSGRTESTALT